MGRHTKIKTLSGPELERFLKAAADMRDACCEPVISASSDHGHALADLNEAIRAAVKTITGREPE
ncbi:MAG: hypothetical protein EHM67_00130, partial [Hyphomicrobiaceae bacterium]